MTRLKGIRGHVSNDTRPIDAEFGANIGQFEALLSDPATDSYVQPPLASSEHASVKTRNMSNNLTIDSSLISASVVSNSSNMPRSKVMKSRLSSDSSQYAGTSLVKSTSHRHNTNLPQIAVQQSTQLTMQRSMQQSSAPSVITSNTMLNQLLGTEKPAQSVPAAPHVQRGAEIAHLCPSAHPSARVAVTTEGFICNDPRVSRTRVTGSHVYTLITSSTPPTTVTYSTCPSEHFSTSEIFHPLATVTKFPPTSSRCQVQSMEVFPSSSSGFPLNTVGTSSLDSLSHQRQCDDVRQLLMGSQGWCAIGDLATLTSLSTSGQLPGEVDNHFRLINSEINSGSTMNNANLAKLGFVSTDDPMFHSTSGTCQSPVSLAHYLPDNRVMGADLGREGMSRVGLGPVPGETEMNSEDWEFVEQEYPNCGRLMRSGDMLLSGGQPADENDLNLNEEDCRGGIRQSAVSDGSSLDSNHADASLHAFSLHNLTPDFLDPSGGDRKGGEQLPTLLSNLATSADLDQLLGNSTMCMDMGSLSETDVSLSGLPSGGYIYSPEKSSSSSGARKSLSNASGVAPELSFANALGVARGESVKLVRTNVISEAECLDNYQVGRQKYARVDRHRQSEKEMLVQQVACFKCCLCSFLSQDQQVIMTHMREKHRTSLPEIDEPERSNKREKLSPLTVSMPPSGRVKRHHPEMKQQVHPTITNVNNVHTISPFCKSEIEPQVMHGKASQPAKPNLMVKSPDLGKRPEIMSYVSKAGRTVISKTLGLVQPRQTRPKRPKVTPVTIRCNVNGCSVKLTTEEGMSYHRRCHGGTCQFQCPECTMEQRTWHSLSIHLWRQHYIDMELYKCPSCDYKTYSHSKLMNVHFKTHGTERSCVCALCGKGFKSAKQLRNHKLYHQKQQDVKTFACEICNRNFTEKRMLLNHLDSVHCKMKPFLCNFCGYASASKSTLKMHMRKHTGEKPFACEECSYCTADHNSYRRHKMRHAGIKPYRCAFCEYACIQSSTFKVHLRTKHPEQDLASEGIMFTCVLCLFKTVRKDNYLAHVAEHSRGGIKKSKKMVDKKQKQGSTDVSRQEMSSTSKAEYRPLEEFEEDEYIGVDRGHVLNIDIDKGSISMQVNPQPHMSFTTSVQNSVRQTAMPNQVMLAGEPYIITTVNPALISQTSNSDMFLTPELVPVTLPIGNAVIPTFVYVSGNAVDNVVATDILNSNIHCTVANKHIKKL